MLELHATIYGNVQGVGFRATTYQIARNLNLKGFVRNKEDNSVEILAQGEKKDLEQLITELKEVFPKRYIHSMDIEYGKPEKNYSGFSITH